jgi:hypothetical protein
MGTYLYLDNSELWEHIQSELWHLSFGIIGSFPFVSYHPCQLDYYPWQAYEDHSSIFRASQKVF